MKTVYALAILFLCGCGNTGKTSKAIADTTSRNEKGRPFATDSSAQFANKIYLKIDQIYTGNVYTDKQNRDVFYRVLVIPEEENTMLIIENIAIGKEGGNYQLLKRVKLRNNDPPLSQLDSLSVNSLHFIDSVTVGGNSGHKKFKIELDKVKPGFPI